MSADQGGQLLQTAWEWLLVPAPFTSAPRAAVLGLLLSLVLAGVLTLWLALPWARRWWSDELARPGEDERGVSTEELTLTEHLIELRNRLVRGIVVLAIATSVAFVFYQRWFDVALWPCRGCQLQAITPTELIFAYFKVTLVVGLLVAMPWIAYEAWAYIAPGLTRKERKYVIAVIPGATVSFLVGVMFAYFALTPAALTFLLHFGNTAQVDIRPTVGSYIGFITRLLIATGAIFELPLAMFFLSKLHLINPKMLGSIRRYVVVAAFIIAAVVTPTPDPFNQLLVAVPIMYGAFDVLALRRWWR